MSHTKIKLISAVAMACASTATFANCAADDEVLFQIDQLFPNITGQEQLYRDRITRSPTCMVASPAAAASRIAATSFAQSNNVLNTINTRFNPPVSSSQTGTGMTAGEPGKRWNVWARYDDNQSSQRFTVVEVTAPATTRTNFDQNARNTQVGADFAVTPSLILGISSSSDRTYHQGDVDQDTVAGIHYKDNRSTTTGEAYAVYVGYQLSNEWVLGGVLGDGKADFSAGGTTASGKRSFNAANIAYSRSVGNWSYSGNLGYIQGMESFGRTRTARTLTNAAAGAAVSGTDGSTKINRAQLGARAAYSLGAIVPFVGLSYVDDRQSTKVAGYSMSAPIGKAGTRVSVGADFIALSAGLSGGLSYEEELGRSNSESRVLSANINFRF